MGNVAVHLNNSSMHLSNGMNIVNADIKYKHAYSLGLLDSSLNNYEANKNMYEDAIYETSSNVTGTYSWYNDSNYFPASNLSCISRGGPHVMLHLPVYYIHIIIMVIVMNI